MYPNRIIRKRLRPINLIIHNVIQAMLISTNIELAWFMSLTCKTGYKMNETIRKIKYDEDLGNINSLIDLYLTQVNHTPTLSNIIHCIRYIKCKSYHINVIIIDYMQSRPPVRNLRRIVRSINLSFEFALKALYFGYVSIFNMIMVDHYLPPLKMNDFDWQLTYEYDAQFMWIMLLTLKWPMEIHYMYLTVGHDQICRIYDRPWNWYDYFDACAMVGLGLNDIIDTIHLIVMFFKPDMHDLIKKLKRSNRCAIAELFEYVAANDLYTKIGNNINICHRCEIVLSCNPFTKIEKICNNSPSQCEYCHIGSEDININNINIEFIERK